MLALCLDCAPIMVRNSFSAGFSLLGKGLHLTLPFAVAMGSARVEKGWESQAKLVGLAERARQFCSWLSMQILADTCALHPWIRALCGTATQNCTFAAVPDPLTSVCSSAFRSAGGLDEQVDEKVIHAAFVPFGEIVEIQLPLDYESGAC